MRQLFVSGCFYVNIGREGKQPEKSRVFICKTFFNASEVLVYENKFLLFITSKNWVMPLCSHFPPSVYQSLGGYLGFGHI